MHRLAQQHLGVVHADDAGQGPGAVRQHDAVDLQFLLNGGEQLVEGVVELAVAQRAAKVLVGGGHVLAVHGVAQGVGAGLVGGQVGRLDGTERVGPVGAAVALEAGRVAVEDFEDRQRPAFLGQLLRHVEGRGEGHHGVEGGVVLAAEGAGVGQGGGGGELRQVGAVAQALGQQRLEFVGRRLLHQRDERIELAEGQPVGGFVGAEPAGEEVGDQGRADAGDEHASSHVLQKGSAIGVHWGRPPRGGGVDRRSLARPAAGMGRQEV